FKNFVPPQLRPGLPKEWSTGAERIGTAMDRLRCSARSASNRGNPRASRAIRRRPSPGEQRHQPPLGLSRPAASLCQGSPSSRCKATGVLLPGTSPVLRTPQPKLAASEQSGSSGDLVTGQRPSPPPATGLQALSLRLSGATLQRRFDRVSEPGYPSSAACPGAVSSFATSDAGASLGIFERSRALGEALEKKAKVGCASSTSDRALSAPPTQAMSEDAGFRRGRLAEWMELAVQHAPPARQGRQARAVPGGLQDAYSHAVRHYLTEASLKTPRGTVVGPALEEALLLAVLEVHEGVEGLVLSAAVLQAPRQRAVQGLQPGSVARLLLHRRLPVLQGSEANGPLVRPGAQLRVGNFSVLAEGRGGRGPLLLPMDVTLTGKAAQR
ncbi:unnamed protein product, partial [Polarella glacialis]